MFSLSSKEVVFFDMFYEASEIVYKAATMLEDLMNNYTGIQEKIEAIEQVEHDCDQQVHKIMQKLNSSFITPIDREDIYLIAKELDNITDAIESTAHRFRMYNVQKIMEESLAFASLIVKSTAELKKVMLELKNLKTSKAMNGQIIEINRLENEGDVIYRNVIAKLFVSEKDPIEVIKWKEIYELLESTLDACEDVANIVEGVVMKHA